MPANANNSSVGFKELVRVLGEAVQAGVTSLSLEYKDRELLVFYQAGNVGLGAGRIAPELQQAVIEQLVQRASLGRKAKGMMQVTNLGRDFEVIVEEYDSFGESAFNLTIKAPKRKTSK